MRNSPGPACEPQIWFDSSQLRADRKHGTRLMICDTCGLVDDPNVSRIRLVYDNWKAKGSQTRGFGVKRWGMQINDKQRDNDGKMMRGYRRKASTTENVFWKGKGYWWMAVSYWLIVKDWTRCRQHMLGRESASAGLSTVLRDLQVGSGLPEVL